MKNLFLITLSAMFLSLNMWAQEAEPLNLRNVLVVGQQDDLSDRYILEVGLLQLFSEYKIKTKASLNVVKQRGTDELLLNDSIHQKLKSEGIDTYLLVSIRGYNKRFKPSDNANPIEEEINAGHLYPLYRESASTVTFSFTFYRDMKPVHYELIKTGTVGSKEAVMKKLLKKVEKRLEKEWL
ncbi:hypothetical protein ERX46_01860 [Brumimicrobium glaciale]|uniref:DUF4136 domain-containing protein n=1 Tax=Brumimicrobium glaciale TaxID=200475 RepID=A0A4Q4KUF6_9FLAO|nr:hypothetical protein [Brumimicrobium glaciale]RYM35764.1 hypothetical protein ERX46_01860 [Brumimicrobium glaciale]